MPTIQKMSFAAVALCLAAATTAAQPQTPPAKPKGATIEEAKLEKRTRAVSCVGDTVTLDGVLLRVDTIAVNATGSCNVVIRNSHVVGTAIAVQLSGTSSATIENSIVEGALALQMAGDTTASVKSSTIRGGAQRVGGAKVRDLGDNIWK